MPCVYNKSRPAHRPGKKTMEQTPYAEALPLQSPAYSPLHLPGLSFDMEYPENSMSTGFLPDVAVESMLHSHSGNAASSNIAMGSFMDFISNNSTSSSSDQWLVHNGNDHLPERPTTPADEEVLTGYSKMAACVSSWLEDLRSLYAIFP